MKKLIALLTVVASTAMAAAGIQSVATENQSTTRAAPAAASEFTITNGSSIGASLDLNDLDGFRIIVCAASGQTLSGAGTMDAYLLDERTGLIARNPEIDLSLSASGVRCQAFGDRQVIVPYGRVIYKATGVTVSGGATIDVHYRGWKKQVR